MLSGVYIDAFNYFLNAIDEIRPQFIDSPLVGLFLLVCDISINPGDGFPFEIKNYEEFVNNTNSGIRFMKLCEIIRKEAPEVKYQIIKYSISEYLGISVKLSSILNVPSPMDISNKIIKWSENIQSLITLMEEEQEFNFNHENFPIRLIFSRFIKFQKDKLINPAFFCWTGVHMTQKEYMRSAKVLFNEHEALYIDGIDADIYARRLPNKSEEAIKNAMNEFYNWVALYDLVKQWIIDDGDFEYNYLWLTSKFSQDETKEWAINIFKQIYGFSPDEFKTI